MRICISVIFFSTFVSINDTSGAGLKPRVVAQHYVFDDGFICVNNTTRHCTVRKTKQNMHLKSSVFIALLPYHQQCKHFNNITKNGKPELILHRIKVEQKISLIYLRHIDQ